MQNKRTEKYTLSSRERENPNTVNVQDEDGSRVALDRLVLVYTAVEKFG